MPLDLVEYFNRNIRHYRCKSCGRDRRIDDRGLCVECRQRHTGKSRSDYFASVQQIDLLSKVCTNVGVKGGKK